MNGVQELIDKYGAKQSVMVQGVALPIIDIPMMSDKRWNELARENAVNNYIKTFGCRPQTVEDAVQWQRDRINQILSTDEEFKKASNVPVVFASCDNKKAPQPTKVHGA